MHPSRRLIVLVVAASIAVASGCSRDAPSVRLERAAAQFDNADYRAAVIELRNVLQVETDNVQARALLGRALFELGDMDAAHRELTRAKELGADPALYAVPLSVALLRRGSPAEALTELERIDAGDRDAGWLVARSEIFAVSGDLENAADSLRRALEIEPASYPATIGLAVIAGRERAWDQVYRFADRAVLLDPGRYEAYLVRGNMFLRTGNPVAAERDLSEAAVLLAKRPASGEELANAMTLASLQLSLGRADGLEQTAERLLGRGAGAVAEFAAGAAAFAQGKFRDAAQKLRDASVGMPNEPRVLRLLGAAELELGLLEQAEQHLLVAVNQDPADLFAVQRLAETRRRQGRPEQALEALSKAAASDMPAAMLAFRSALLLEVGRPADAVAALERAVALAPQDPRFQLQLARAYAAAKRTDDASRSFSGLLWTDAERAIEIAVAALADRDGGRAHIDALLRSRPDDGETVMAAAVFHSAVGEEHLARELLTRAVKSAPAFVAPRLVLAALAVIDGDTAAAYEHYLAISRQAPGNARAWLGLAQIHTLRGELAAAREALSSAERITPNDADVLTLAGVVAQREGNLKLAVERFGRAAALRPESSAFWHNLARAQRDLGDFAGAHDSLRRAAGAPGSSSDVRLELAAAELAAANLEAARRLARQVQFEQPQNAAAFLIEGDVAALSGDDLAAAELFDRAFQRVPSFEAASKSFMVRRRAGAEAAEAPLLRWLDIDRADARAWWLLAELYTSDGRTAEALDAYETLLELEPDHVAALNNVAWLYAERGDHRSIRFAERAYNADPTDPAVADTYGWALVRSGDARRGVELLRQALTGRPGSGEVQYRLAYGLARIGRGEEARALLQQIVDTAEDSLHAQQAKLLLAEL